MKITGKRPQFFISGNIHTAIQCTLSKKPLLDDGYCLEIAISERIDLRLGWQYFIDLSIGVFGTFRLVRVTDYPSQFVNRQFDYIYQFDSIGDLTIGKSGAFSASQRYPEWSIKTRDDWLTFADFLEEQGDNSCQHIRDLQPRGDMLGFSFPRELVKQSSPSQKD